MNVLQATKEHLDLIAPLFNQYRIFYKQAPDLQGCRNFLEERFEIKDSVIFLAVSEDGTGLGFTQLYPSFSSVSMQKTYILNDLFVEASARAKGIGEKLLEKAKEYAMRNGSKGLTLETEISNPAQHLYERLGWKKDTHLFHYTWEV